MNDELTAGQLIGYFQDRIEAIDRSMLGAVHGKEPHYPMVVFFLGDAAISGYEAMSHNLFQVWPQFESELRFIGVRKSEDGLSYASLRRGGEEALTDDDLVGVLDELASSENFANHSTQLLYYVLDSSSLEEADEIDAWIDDIETIKQDLYVFEDEIRQMLFVLLDESTAKRRISRDIRNTMSAYCHGESRCRYAVVLLSNRQKGNRFEKSWDSCYRICTSLMALSNNDDSEVSVLWDKGVVTVSYVHDEKPVHDTGQVVVENVVNFLANEDDSSYVTALTDGDLKSRLGLTSDGTLAILDDYVDSTLVPMLPSDEVINLFPRLDDGDYGDISQFTARDLDGLTMNTWSAYLDRIMDAVRERVRTDTSQRQRWVSQYRSMLNDEFKVGELIYLADHPDEVRNAFTGVRDPSPDGNAREYAKRKLRAMLSSDETLVNLFVQAVQEQAKRSREFRSVWDNLHQSFLKLIAVRDKNLATFYQSKVRTYFDRHKVERYREFRELSSTDELRIFLQETVNSVIDSDAVFTSSYEEEQESRLSRDANAQDAQRYIRQKLTGDNVHTYLRVNFSLGNTILHTVLLKSGTRLSENLKRDLSSETYFYDTGYGNAVEVLNVHEVLRENLVSGEAR